MTIRFRFLASLTSLIALVVGVPCALVAVSRWRFGHALPLVAWPSWSDVSSGAAGTAPLTEVVVRVTLLGAWCCVLWLLASIVAEVVFQIRHGMASTPRRPGPLAPVVRSVAAGLVVLLPLAHHAPSALAARAVDVGTLVAPSVPPASSSIHTGVTLSGSVRVRAGDSVWSIAEAIVGRDGADRLAEQIVELNLGRTMNDGGTFSTAALIEPGWELRLPTGATDGHVVAAGDSYWSIAEDHLLWPTPSAVLTATHQLIDGNAPRLGYTDDRMLHPGDVVMLDVLVDAPQVTPAPAPEPVPVVVAPTAVPVAPLPTVTPTSTTSTTSTSTTSTSTPIPVSDAAEAPDRGSGRNLEGAVLLGAGVLGVLAARRRARLRSAEPGARLPLVLGADLRTEAALQASQRDHLLARVDLVERVLGDALVSDGVAITALAIDSVGSVRVWFDRAVAAVPAPFVAEHDGTARLPAAVAIEVLAEQSNGGVFPAPALVHLGRCDHGELFVDVEAVGSLAVDLDESRGRAVLRHLVAALAVSPFAAPVRLSVCDVDDPLLHETGQLPLTADDSVAEWSRHRELLDRALGSGCTDAARRRGGSEAWEPDVLVSLEPRSGLDVSPRRGCALVGGSWVSGQWRLVADEDAVVLQPLGLRVHVVELDDVDTAAAADLLAAANEPLLAAAAVVELQPVSSAATDVASLDYTFLVRTLGHVDVIDTAGASVRFEKAKSQELVVWLAHHRQRSTRGAARSAMWSVDVRDATFANVVSDARRSLARALPPPDDVEWIGRTLTDDLPLHDDVVTDGDLLQRSVDMARGADAAAACAHLRSGLEMVTGLPFAGTGYLWPDAEGITSSLLLLSTGAAATMAEHCLQLGDIDGVFWATGRGLQVLPGQEELIALRMRAHAGAGDLSGVRAEWDAYERALAADPWSDPEPAPKLVRLRSELLSPVLSA